MKHIEIEAMLFGDYRVCVWEQVGESYNECLDKEYFCRGYDSAVDTAKMVRKDLFPGLEIKLRTGDELKTIIAAA